MHLVSYVFYQVYDTAYKLIKINAIGCLYNPQENENYKDLEIIYYYFFKEINIGAIIANNKIILHIINNTAA